ncbi:MAG: Na+/H+ antiporter subunit E [Gammaproteobacteria bacterium]|nr:Na+/H+ antiporter subunit E [Gammaproteobacteria bacterium]
MKRLLPHPLLSLILVLVWVLLSNALSAASIILGLLLGWLIPLFTRQFWPERVVIRRPLTLLRLIAVVLSDIVTANFIVAGLILRGPRRLRPCFLRLPLELQSDLAISLLSNTICLTPGTVSAELSADRRYLLIHALSTDDPEAVLRTIKQRYEAPLKEVFEP